MKIEDHIRTVPNFPSDGIMFRDVSTLLFDATVFKTTIDQFAERWSDKKIDIIAGIDARGFIFGAALSYKLGLPLTLCRKKGKLPAETISEKYALEYGIAELEVHVDSVRKSQSVLIVDDLIATGGTALAAVSLIKKLGAQIAGCGFVVDLPEVGGSMKLRQANIEVRSLVEFEGP